jgi:LEA14-like dessication related protein
MMKGTTFLLLLTGGMAATYGYMYLSKQAELLKSTGIKYSGGRVIKLGLSNIQLLLRIELENKSDTNLVISGQDYIVYFAGKKVAVLASSVETYFPSMSKAYMEFNVSFNPVQILQIGVANIAAFLTDKSKIKIRTVGKVSVRTGILFYNSIPVDIESSLADFL